VSATLEARARPRLPALPPTRRRLAIAALLFTLSFGVYGALAPPLLEGYEHETAAVAEGLVRGEGARIPEDSQLAPDSGGEIGRGGILQPLLMTPFYAAGAGLDELASSGDDYTYRDFALRLYSAAVTAACVALLFLLMVALGRSEGWAVVTALLFAFASFAFPYAGIGMEPTTMLTVILAFLVASYAARSRNLWLWAGVGLAIGLAAATRAGAGLPALAAVVLLWPAFRSASPAQRLRLGAALAAPVVLGLVAFLGYNAYRYDDLFETGYGRVRYSLGEIPFAAIGLYLSPGKGLAWYSPLVILGALGLVALWRGQRLLAVALLVGLALGTIPYLTYFWSDDTWGPRYLLSVSWLLLIPIAWWATTRTRRWIVAAVAAVAVWVQLLGVLVGFYAYSDVLLRGYTGVKVYGPYVGVYNPDIPYGDDPIRWIPELSPLVFNSEALVSLAARGVGLPEREAEYRPFRGLPGTASFDQVRLFVWWNRDTAGQPDIPQPSPAWITPFLLLAGGSALGLWALRAGLRRAPTSA
jgi:hypothetical protein